MRDETTKDNRQTAAGISHDLIPNNQLVLSSTRNLQFSLWVSLKRPFYRLSHAGQNYWMLIGWDRVHFFLIKRALVIKRAWLLDADWLSTPALNWFPASNGFWKGISETHRFFWVWCQHGHFILTWKKINTQQSAVFWWKSKRIFPTKNVLIRSLKTFLVGTAGVTRSTRQNLVAYKTES